MSWVWWRVIRPLAWYIQGFRERRQVGNIEVIPGRFPGEEGTMAKGSASGSSNNDGTGRHGNAGRGSGSGGQSGPGGHGPGGQGTSGGRSDGNSGQGGRN